MLLAFIFIIIFSGLGTWQVMRAQEKKQLLQSFAERTQETPLIATDLNKAADLRFKRVTVSGKFDNEHSILLDNKTYHGQIGYEVYTPFRAEGFTTPILVDRGFIPLGKDRKVLPRIDLIIGKINITGMLNMPPYFYTHAQMIEKMAWPLRVEYLNLSQLAQTLTHPLYQYVLILDPHHPASYQNEWKIVIMGPERHMGYAVQWFALALTLLIISLVLNRRRPDAPS